MNATSPTPRDIRALVDSLTVERKVRLLTGQSDFTLWDEPAVGLPAIDVSDGPTGVRGLKFVGGAPAVLFPSATVLASTWDEDILEEVGSIVADEAERQHIATVLGPTINLHRSPLGGRLFEQYSEDPLLSGRLAVRYVRGVQGKGIGACLKHWLANESETERTAVSSDVDEQTLREVYMMPFQIAVEDAHPWWIMASYNRVNGTPATEHSGLLRQVLRDEWAWDGVVVSDWLAAQTTVESANGGLDLVMPGPDGPWGDALVQAVRDGRVSEDVIDEKVTRLLTWADRVGQLGRSRSWRTDVPAPDAQVRVDHLTRIAAKGFVLLKNADGVLPLARGAKVVAIGRPVLDTVEMGGGSAIVNAVHLRSIADGLGAHREAFGELTILDGVEVRERAVPAEPGFLRDPISGRPGIRVRLFDSDGGVLADQYRPDTCLIVDSDKGMGGIVTRVEITAELAEGGTLELGVRGSGDWTLHAGDAHVEHRLELAGHDPGESSLRPPDYSLVVPDVAPRTLLTAVCDIASGGFAPSQTDNDVLGVVNNAGFGLKGVVARVAPRPASDIIADAVAAARDADVAIVAVGNTEERETEAMDKTTLALPGEQDRLVREVAAVARRTVVVVNSSTPVLMPWEDEVDAVLVVGLPGQEGGIAVAKVLLGELEPSGRLVTTWPTADGLTPGWLVRPDENKELHYADRTFVGYRGHAPYGLAPAPRHWFGEGLGFGEVTYSDARLLPDGSGVGVSVRVSNAAARPTRETVQVYARPADASQPVRLAGFVGVDLGAGGDAVVEVRCDPRLLRRWDTQAHAWEPLEIAELLVARSLGDVRARLGV